MLAVQPRSFSPSRKGDSGIRPMASIASSNQPGCCSRCRSAARRFCDQTRIDGNGSAFQAFSKRASAADNEGVGAADEAAAGGAAQPTKPPQAAHDYLPSSSSSPSSSPSS